MWTYNYNDTYFVGNELYHFGVKGMKWKHRKHYSNELLGRTTTIQVGGGPAVTTHTYGQWDKFLDQQRANSVVRKTVNKTNPYKWNSNKTVSKNVKSNANTYKRRRKLKKAGYMAVAKLFKHL